MIYRKFGTSSELVAAIVGNDLAAAESLLSHGPDSNGPDENGWRPLHAAIGQTDFWNLNESIDSVAFVELLIRYGADVNRWDVNRNETPLLTACDPPNIR